MSEGIVGAVVALGESAREIEPLRRDGESRVHSALRARQQSTNSGDDSASLGMVEFPEPPTPIKPQVLYSRHIGKGFADAAVALGMMPAKQLVQWEARAAETGRTLEEVLVESGRVTVEQVRDVHQAISRDLFVDQRLKFNPAFLTWTRDLKRAGIDARVEYVSAERLAALRDANGGEVAGPVANDQRTLQRTRQLFASLAAMGINDLAITLRKQHTEIQVRYRGDVMDVVDSHLSMDRASGEEMIRCICTGLSTSFDSYYKPTEFQNGQIDGAVFGDVGMDSVRFIRGPAWPDGVGGFLRARLQYSEHESTRRAGRVDTRPLKLRVPAKPEGEPQFAKMGFTARQISLIDEILWKPMGLFIVLGPTNSGKTTTIHELLKHQKRLFPATSQIAIENPTELPMPWALQLTTDNFVEYVAHGLRMDPDTIVVGEIRRSPEALAAMHAGRTGHFVVSTLHENDPFGLIDRLEGLDVEELPRRVTCAPGLLAGFMGQRVVPILCPTCRRPLNPSHDLPPHIAKVLPSWGDTSLMNVRGPGCETCDGSGVIDRRAVAEIVVATPQLLDDLRVHGSAIAAKNHRARPGSDLSMLENAMKLVIDGVVSPIDVHRNVAEIVEIAQVRGPREES
ncbi:ATPase, T2SS/T4P/T4SS family [Burkholderia vietnamiensis]|uniref:ATPase, T2SS/T4P/T4SS family n=1 Tax=Burkholderia vietnamiensis TaxID=60552 RepID=UPI001589281E|nr:ATPase, T2SS/T4P/T4SS family [Burkholderia vietnamiensis]HDR9018067.1 Flp pilus assembly complex ATPase component TadA [Burkholderia vietnamiensis]HDR9101287.1 Flp pilus assembly complex ATPase component TadA [Burkholderia vietnamiensis]